MGLSTNDVTFTMHPEWNTRDTKLFIKQNNIIWGPRQHLNEGPIYNLIYFRIIIIFFFYLISKVIIIFLWFFFCQNKNNEITYHSGAHESYLQCIFSNSLLRGPLEIREVGSSGPWTAIHIHTTNNLWFAEHLINFLCFELWKKLGNHWTKDYRCP